MYYRTLVLTVDSFSAVIEVGYSEKWSEGLSFFASGFLTMNEGIERGYMEKAEVKLIADYIEELKSSLDHRDCQGAATYRHLIKLHLTIARLAEMACAAENEQLQPTLAVLASKALRCKQCIEKRLAVHS